MNDHKVSIRYGIDQIFACREENFLMPKELKEYCSHFEKSQMSILAYLIKPMDDVTKSHSRGINPNDISLKNLIREYLNKIDNSNYDAVLNDLKCLNFCSEAHFSLLADELIIKSMNDVVACKGLESSKPGKRTPSELYCAIACEFSHFSTQQNGVDIKFKTVLTRVCQRYFEQLTDKRQSMDQNNPTRVANYKGFANMIGLMYNSGLFPKDIVRICLGTIVELILDPGLPQEDRDNYYSGFERLVNRIMIDHEKQFENIDKQVNQQTVSDVKIADALKESVRTLEAGSTNVTVQRREGGSSKSVDLRALDQKALELQSLFNRIESGLAKLGAVAPFLSEYNKAIATASADKPGKTSADEVKPIRKYSIMIHQQNMTRFDRLLEMIAINGYLNTYVKLRNLHSKQNASQESSH
jgi:hypothetical protein